MAEKKEFKNTQIIRKDAKNCFVETKSDCFSIGKVVFNFVQYDATKPEGNRATNSVSIFMPVDDMLLLASQITGGELARMIADARSKTGMTPIYQHLGGTNAAKAKRQDNMSLSRNVSLTVGRSALFFTAESGPGEVSGTGIIVPKYKTPEQRVSVSLSVADFSKLIITTAAHYQAYLSTLYK